jgi:carotenoid phi-ring synthase / carotenoid chi-ring synthase
MTITGPHFDPMIDLPGRDRRAVRIPAATGARETRNHSAAVIGGGIAGLAAAAGLAERGVRVTLIEPHEQLGGRVRSWPVEGRVGPVTMSRGFHAFFRQYYNLRKLLLRADQTGTSLRPVADYPLLRVTGERDSFARLPRTPPLSFVAFVLTSPTFTLRGLRHVDVDAALSLLDVDFPDTYDDFDGVSAAEFLDRLRFPEKARHLALEVFSRSFFADPRDFSAGELVAMFHTYFLGSAEGLLFDVPVDDFDTALWTPLGSYLNRIGVERRVSHAETIEPTDSGTRTQLADGSWVDADAIVVAAGPASSRRLVVDARGFGNEHWRTSVGSTRSAPPFAVWRLWLDRPVLADRPAFLGTSGFGPLDNISVLERFENGARRWADQWQGSVVELHAYALSVPVDRAAITAKLRAALDSIYPETADAEILFEQWLVEQDCPLIDTSPWRERPAVTTPDPRLVLAGDGIRCDYPVALMERAATTGWMAANELLSGWGVAGHDLWTVPLAARHHYAGRVRRMLSGARGKSG